VAISSQNAPSPYPLSLDAMSASGGGEDKGDGEIMVRENHYPLFFRRHA